MQHFICNVDCCNPKEGLNKIVSQLRPKWIEKGFTSENFTGGLVNSIFFCKLDGVTDSRDAIVVKVFPDVDIKRYMGNSLEEWRFVGAIAERVGCGPVMLASFQNGVVYEYVGGRSVTRRMMRDENIMRKSTKLLAKFHSEQIEEMKDSDNRILQREHFVEKLRNLFHYIPEELGDHVISSGSSDVIKEQFHKAHLVEEFQKMVKLLDDLQLTMVFSHGDFHYKNIVYDRDTDSLKLMDYDLTSFNYEAYDLSHLLFEQTYLAAFGVKEEDDPGDYDDDVMRLWISHYLRAKADISGQQADVVVNRKRVEMMLVECKIIQRFSHLMVTMFSLANLDNPFFNYVSLSTAQFAYENFQREKKALPDLVKEHIALKSQFCDETGHHTS